MTCRHRLGRGPDGRYVIAGAPLWLPRMPPVTQPATVGASGSVTANFKLANPSGN